VTATDKNTHKISGQYKQTDLS